MIRLLRLAAVALIVLAAQAVAVTPKPGPKPEKYTADYAALKSPTWKGGFPRLGGAEVLAPATGREDRKNAYNCIAHTLRIYHKWVWPGNRVADFDKLYGSHGYRRVRGLDYRFDAGVEKIVLYAKVHSDGRIECTHGAKQLTDGSWTSKLGGGPLVRHNTPESVGGPNYGRPVAVYVRPRKVPLIESPAPTPKRSLASKAY